MIEIIITGPRSGRRLFELDTGDLFVRVPFVGQGIYDPYEGWLWDWWSDLKPGDG